MVLRHVLVVLMSASFVLGTGEWTEDAEDLDLDEQGLTTRIASDYIFTLHVEKEMLQGFKNMYVDSHAFSGLAFIAHFHRFYP
ncbi:unnamed protein product [Pieris brassicae]|uniref:Uncharacterized protein n=1 Tax=Pieris brassicae TaxID=7116 RepID=A0A9P0TR22_PIEBR|nr:unnamed protein product [Pieris brassicae]